MGWTLSRYFFFRYVTITTWFFLGIAALVFIIDFTELSSRTSDIANFSTGMALGVSAMRVPMVMQQTIPFIALFSAMATLVSLNRKYELVVARSVGVSAWQFLRPACFGALLLGLLTLGVLNPIAAAGYSRAEAIEASYRATKNSAVVGTPWIKQTTQEEGETIIGARTTLQQGLELVDAVFFRIDKAGNIAERIDAQSAHLKDGYWELTDASRMRDGSRPEAVGTMQIKTNLRPEFVQERLARPDMIPFFELPRKIEVARSFGLKANAFAMQFHSLVALPLLLVAMTLIAATVSMRFTRLGQSATMILGGVVAGFLLYVVSVLVKAFGTAGFVPPAIAAWLPVVVAMFFGVTFLLYKEDG
ncbi:MAG TPA: LPS export ABC transporter permease LptG [Rhizobiaceae bacterium]|nr:LPS export ABC transporter permease LptG [Rhizobiaceae bacterium]